MVGIINQPESRIQNPESRRDGIINLLNVATQMPSLRDFRSHLWFVFLP
jgi:hypothetical protein